MIPEHLKYAPTHEWFHVESKSITVGLTKYIVDELDKLLFLDLPKVGDEILANISFGEVESLENLLDIMSPMAGEIIAVNERLFENLDILSNDPYVHGWLIKFVTKEQHLLSELLSAQEYAAHINKLHPAAPLKRRKRRGKVIIKGKRRK
ncbi:MAG: glycine cleavage system protein H [Planctomycetes bacterium]|nr:glycine cleavage system protein H [Planctomycetota bacterium]